MKRKEIRKFYEQILQRCTDIAGVSIVFQKILDHNGSLILCAYCKEIANVKTLVPYEILNATAQTHCTFQQGNLTLPAMWAPTSWRALQGAIEELQVWADTWLPKLENTQ